MKKLIKMKILSTNYNCIDVVVAKTVPSGSQPYLRSETTNIEVINAEAVAV